MVKFFILIFFNKSVKCFNGILNSLFNNEKNLKHTPRPRVMFLENAEAIRPDPRLDAMPPAL